MPARQSLTVNDKLACTPSVLVWVVAVGGVGVGKPPYASSGSVLQLVASSCEPIWPGLNLIDKGGIFRKKKFTTIC